MKKIIFLLIMLFYHSADAMLAEGEEKTERKKFSLTIKIPTPKMSESLEFAMLNEAGKLTEDEIAECEYLYEEKPIAQLQHRSHILFKKKVDAIQQIIATKTSTLNLAADAISRLFFKIFLMNLSQTIVNICEEGKSRNRDIIKLAISICLDLHATFLSMLIKKGLNINIFYEEEHRKTPLMYATQQGFSPIVKVLLENKATIFTKNSNGARAIDYANPQYVKLPLDINDNVILKPFWDLDTHKECAELLLEREDEFTHLILPMQKLQLSRPRRKSI